MPTSSRAPLRRTPPVVVAAALACCYAVGLVVLAVALVVPWVARQGTIGHLAGNAANRGVAFVVAACLAGAALLVLGARGAWRGRRGLPAMIPLAVVTVVGCIGEPIDIASGNPVGDNLVGAAIIAAAVVPLVLLLVPRRAAAQASKA